ncbi:MFS general substrate transporter [Thelephora ganbajun]|uniref:MFS general substrate transporter n=1 Tax=Thelephora ganbajun TaxID=370292 RepID=A0ACB6ZVD2_THEGA|nr:MFS general substrate transporter [Thelephora ganbajun]
MTFASNADADPDPTTQMTWPSSRRNASSSGILKSNYPRGAAESQTGRGPLRLDPTIAGIKTLVNPAPKRRLTTKDLIFLSISMAGAQIAWTVELGYGTPFLLTLGLSEQLTSLVWLAGPISGLIAQPLIGAISDSSTSKYRRRYWIVLSTVVLVVSTLILAYCKQLAGFLVDLFGGGQGDWDPKRADYVVNTAIGLAVVSFYLLDFALNALQASLRNLLLDITPADQLNVGNAWHSRMTQAGNIIGYGFGFLPLEDVPILRWIGGTQFRKFCIVVLVVLVITVWVTCWTQEERERPKKQAGSSPMKQILGNIHAAILKLPPPIKKVCAVQLFAFMGWFPFLFYATTYIGQAMAREKDAEPDAEYATRMGALSMLFNSVVAVVAGALLPYLSRRDDRLLRVQDEDEEEENARLRGLIYEWRAEAAKKGKTMKLPTLPVLYRTIWIGALVLFTVLTMATFLVTSAIGAIIIVSLVGISWAVACWVPFAIIMEVMTLSPRYASFANFAIPSERQPLLARATASLQARATASLQARATASLQNYEEETLGPVDRDRPVAGGTVLGIHNLAIVFPQFLVSLATSLIFKIVDGSEQNDETTYYGRNGVAWVLRFGGFCTLFGAIVARSLPLTKTEEEMQYILEELTTLSKEGTMP